MSVIQIHTPFVESNPLDLTGRLADYFGRIERMNVLNLGAGRCDTPISEQVLRIQCETLVSIDTHEPALADLKKKPSAAKMNIFVEGDIRSAFDTFKIIDLVIALDVIEHLELEDAKKLIERAKQVARERILIWVPIGDCPQDPYDGNPNQLHRSTWTAEMLAEMGFDVTVYRGMHKHFNPPVDAAWAMWNNPTTRSVFEPSDSQGIVA